MLRISGQGFVSGGEYYCRYRELSGPRAVWSLADAIRPYDAAERRRPRSVLSLLLAREEGSGVHLSYVDMPLGGLQCIVPRWLFHAQNVSFSVGTSPLGTAVPLTGEAHQSDFAYLPAWENAAVENSLISRVAASGNTLVHVLTFGLDPASLSSFLCKFLHDQQSLMSGAVAINETMLACLTPAWGLTYASANVTLSIYHAGSLIPRLGAELRLEYYPTWEPDTVPLSRVSSSPFGGHELHIKGFGFSDIDLYMCLFTSLLHTAWSNTAAPSNVSHLACITPAWPNGNHLVNVSLFYSPSHGTDPRSVPATNSKEQFMSMLYTGGWESKSQSEALAQGGSILTITGTGFKTEISKHMNYTCRFARLGLGVFGIEQKNAINGAQVGVLESFDIVSEYWVDSPNAHVVTDTELTCIIPSWPHVATRIHVMLLQMELASNAHFRAQALPHRNGAQEFRYFQHWADVSTSDAASTFAASGNEILHITGMGFDLLGTGYECVFTSITHAVEMRTPATIINTTHARCVTPEWGAAGYQEQMVHVELYTSVIYVFACMYICLHNKDIYICMYIGI